MTNDRVVWVAGVGGGLGTAVVLTLLADGSTVVGLARRRATLDRLAAAPDGPGRFEAEPADLTSTAEVEAAAARTIARHGRIDSVALLAGRWVPGPTAIHELSEGLWAEAIEGNLTPIHRVLHAVVPGMIERGRGSIVLVSATEAVRARGSAAYAAAKAGVAELAGRLAADYRRNGIRVNAVLPGNMGREAATRRPDDASPVPLAAANPTAPWAVARAVRFLLSDESAWTTGATLRVDGGFSTGGAEPTP
ncbi:MAG TPA: SDR family oxidoreductase [Thermoplasmata archaeon]|nr:SDR family oxidoreductase [Thermoplasmata archaeon]